MVNRARLTPETAKIRNAVTTGLQAAGVVPGDLVLVACSGGRDSLALAIAAAFVAKRDAVRAGAAIINHGLQPNSAEVAKRAAELCEGLGLDPVVVRSVLVSSSGEGLEAAARRARYQELEAIRVELGAKFVLLGHTMDDQAETVLLGLARGSGIHSISGMNPHSGTLLRPLLRLTRAETGAVCAAAGLAAWDDPHNFDERFSRVRIRNRVLPTLERELGPGVAAALARTAELASEDDQELAAQAKQLLDQILLKQEPLTMRIPVARLANAPRPIASRLIVLVLRQLHSTPSFIHVNSVLELVSDWHGQRALDLPGVKVERAGDELVFRSTKTPSAIRSDTRPER